MTSPTRLKSWLLLLLLWAGSAASAPFSADTHDVYPGDFTGDGKSDLLVIAKDPLALSGIYATDASGQPSTQLQSWSSGFLGINWHSGRYTAVIGNFNGVGGDDVLLQRNGTGTSFLLPTNGQGQLYGISQYINGWGTDAYRIIAGKFDDNARADVFLQARQPSSNSSVILSDESGHLTITGQSFANNHLGFKWSVANAIVHVGDFDGNGRDDLLVQAKPEIVLIDYDIPIPVPAFKPYSFGILLSNTVGQFTSPQQIFSRKDFGVDFSPKEVDIVVGKFNNDSNGNKADVLLLARKAGQPSFLVPTNGNGQLTATGLVNLGAGTLGAELRTLVADFNADGRSELYRVASTASGSNTIVSFTSSGSIASNVTHSAPPISNNMGTLVGRLAGEFGVDANGAATYEIPIDVPEGTNGLSPDLSLVYSSMSDNGGLGVGWSLSGLSAITRCPRTLDQDGVVRGVELTSNDRFCLDGNKLRTTSGTAYGANGTTYQTELETLSRVTSYSNGAAGYVPSSGPQYFKVESKDGLYLFYGSTVDARVEVTGTSMPRLWALNRIEDRDGNYLTLTYAKGNGAFRPATIEWARSAAGTGPFFRTRFIYESRPASDVQTSYFAGGRIVEDQRLDRLEVQAFQQGSWELVRQYDVTYEAGVSSTGSSRVASITQCSASECLPATVFEYRNGIAGWTSVDSVSGAEASAVLTSSYALDVDGDSRTDLVYPQGGFWYVMRSTGSGYAAPQSSSIQAGSTSDLLYTRARPIRRPDGTAGLLIRKPANAPQGDKAAILSWNGTGLVATAVNVAATRLTGQEWVGDFDGDAIDDLMYFESSGGLANFFVRRGFIGGSGQVDFAAATSVLTTNVNGVPQRVGLPSDLSVTDVNGDNKADAMYEVTFQGPCDPANPERPCETIIERSLLVSTGSSFVQVSGSSCTTQIFLDCSAVVLGDFNGDSLTDVIFPTAPFSSQLRFGSGAGLSVAETVSSPALEKSGRPFVIDYDNDDRDDLLARCGSSLCVYRFNGSGFDAGIATGIAAPEAFRLVDLDGDAQQDIGYKSGTWRVRLHNGAGFAPDQMTRIRDGLGNTVTPVYGLLTDSTFYTKSSGAAYPLVDLLAPIYVVKNYTANTGIGPTFITFPPSPTLGLYTVSYRYQGARAHLRGRGFLGFLERKRIDDRPGNELVTVESYRQDFPYVGNVASSTVYQPGGSTKISQIDNTYEALVLDSTVGNGRVLPYNRSVLESKYEVGGPNNGQLVTSSTTTNTVDVYGNLTLQEVVAKDEFLASPLNGSVYRSVSDNTYTPNTSTWCLGVVQTARVKSQPAGASAATTRTKSFVVDETKCRATQELIEPGDPKLQVTTAIAYFPMGHASAGQISSRTVTGINMAPRTTSYEYHPSGPLVTKTTDALGHTNQSEWNAGLEFQTASIDLNGKRIEFGSDSIGRKTRELRPDGTRVDYRYFPCSSGCGLAYGKFQIVTTTSAQGSIIDQSASIYDALGRVIQSTDWLLGGAQSHVLTEYDVMGRVSRRSAPFFTGAAVYWATTTYDVVGRPLSERRPVSETDSSLQSITWSHEGLRMRQTDANGKVITQRRDAINRTVQMTDAAGTHTWYEYDPFGNALRTYVGDANGTPTAGTVITNQFDVRGRKKRSDDPDMGVWTYEYDALDQLTSQTDARGNQITQGYDLLGRLISRSELEGNSSWTYDTAPNGIGLLHTVSSPGGYAEAFGYDTLGRQVSETTTIDGTQYLVTAAYNTFGQVETIEYPQSYPTNYRFKVRFIYDYGLLKRVEDATASSTVYWQAIDTDAAGEITTEQLGNGIGTSSWYDNVSGVLRQRYSGPGYSGSVQALQYQWDRQGNLTQRRDNNQNVTENFHYDSLYRLDYSTLTMSGTTVTNLDLSYDALGNISSMTGNGTYTYHPTKKHAVVSTSSGQVFGYDANGNMINRNGSAIDWYSYNLPKKLRDGTDSAEFFYNADRDRYKQIAVSSDGTETTTYLGSLMERVVKPNGVVEFKHNIPGADGGAAIYTRRSNGVYDTRYLTTDHLGSVDTITNEAGTVLARLNYDAFGKRRNFLPNDLTVVKAVTHIGFTGQEMLDNIDLVHMNGRVYDPMSGRFISADPFVQDPLNSQSLNRYSYVANNPLSLIDPSGFSFISKIGKKIGRAFQSAFRAFRGAAAAIVGAAVFVVCAALTTGADGGGRGCTALAQAGVTVTAGILGKGIERRPPPENIFEAPPGPSLPPGTIVFVGAPSQAAEIGQAQSEDTVGDAIYEIFIDFVKNGIIPTDAIKTLLNPNATWKERALAALEVGLALSPAKAASLTKLLYKAGKRIKAFAAARKAPDVCLLCFAAGTMVATANGEQPIERLEVGDEVISVNESTGETELKKVLQVFVNPNRPIWELTIAGEDGSVDVHRVTENHPYWVKGMGWLPVAQLHAGMQLTSGNGQALQLSNVRFTGAVETTYNLGVADWHTFLVGRQRVLAHNCFEVDNTVDITKRLSQKLRNKLKRIKNQTAAGGPRGVTGTVSEADSLRLATEFLGPGARPLSKGNGLISADGKRVFRFATEKRGINRVTGERYSRTGRQVNFETRDAGGTVVSNVHLDVL